MTADKLSIADQIFDRLDTDGDGKLVEQDYRAAAERLLQSYGMGPNSPKGRALIEAHLAVWEREAELVDRDHDGAITREEYREWFTSKAAPDHGSPEVLAMLHAQFHVADRDGDGTLSLQDFVAWRALRGVSAETAASAFALIDSDGDGGISWDDFAAAGHAHGLLTLLYGRR
ncbi:MULTISPECIES: EF-hand domain-containing protein [unclassified Streptomyces]|uniref:EF-hand domain-containing protein n=1 Tax=unclassified Streptomyces TaxID=2593676 RepID=UPI001BE93FF5|nr:MULTISPECIES: EF-hand domain-containing protein [unclassified Streptomyces]MBT2406521.1 EF-hand domain-containing protein [Streptomyces sp. ISL-21]MBT2459830.1 EF-hand domain-containing protein [Streptomyces sp. ISL-86]MBT2608859.1 EF-hand domain-containing protein [Streptomyces sp. ISL-87]